MLLLQKSCSLQQGNSLTQGRRRRDGRVQPAGIMQGRAPSLLGVESYICGAVRVLREGDMMVVDMMMDLGRFLKAIRCGQAGPTVAHRSWPV